MVKSYWTFGLPSVITRFIGKLGNNVDIFLVKLFWSATNVGIYASGYRFAMIISGLSMAVSNVLFPEISKSHSNLDWERIKLMIKKSSRYISLFVSPVIVFMILFPREIIHIMLQDQFLPAAPVVRILGLNAFFLVYTTPFRNLFGGINKPKLTAKISVFGNIINVCLNFLLIPDSLFGIPLAGLKEVGAALATLTAGIIISGFSLFIANRESGVTPSYGTVLHILAAINSGLIIYFVNSSIEPITRYYHLIGYSFGLLLIYLVILYLLGEFTKKDWNFIMNTIHPGEMLKYIKDELTGKHD